MKSFNFNRIPNRAIFTNVSYYLRQHGSFSNLTCIEPRTKSTRIIENALNVSHGLLNVKIRKIESFSLLRQLEPSFCHWVLNNKKVDYSYSI